MITELKKGRRNMKMKKETVQQIVGMLEDKKDMIQRHKEWLKENARYNSLETRLAMDCWWTLPQEFRMKTTEEQDLKDAHVRTGMKQALKQIDINFE